MLQLGIAYCRGEPRAHVPAGVRARGMAPGDQGRVRAVPAPRRTAQAGRGDALRWRAADAVARPGARARAEAPHHRPAVARPRAGDHRRGLRDALDDPRRGHVAAHHRAARAPGTDARRRRRRRVEGTRHALGPGVGARRRHRAAAARRARRADRQRHRLTRTGPPLRAAPLLVLWCSDWWCGYSEVRSDGSPSSRISEHGPLSRMSGLPSACVSQSVLPDTFHTPSEMTASPGGARSGVTSPFSTRSKVTSAPFLLVHFTLLTFTDVVAAADALAAELASNCALNAGLTSLPVMNWMYGSLSVTASGYFDPSRKCVKASLICLVAFFWVDFVHLAAFGGSVPAPATLTEPITSALAARTP